MLAALLVAAAFAARLGLAGAAVLVALSLLWLRANTSMEGDVLLPVTATHGITEGDLVGVTGLALAAYVAVVALARRS